jgi:2'-5' RNA ligase
VSGVRAFLAADLPADARACLARNLEDLREAEAPDVRWSDPAALHLTLKFCGDVPEERVDELIERCAPRVCGIQPFDVAIAGLGAFPNAREARVIWAGITSGAGELARLARKLDSACARLGIERERRPYQPHLTLGRLRQPRRVALERLVPPSGIAFRVAGVVCFHSRLSPRGAQHVPLARLPLGAAGDLDFAPDIDR